MSKSVLISIRPEWCVKIANGKKTIEVRKTRPNLKHPFKCYIYCTKSPPYMVFGDEFQETEYTTIYGYSRKEAERIWGTMNGKVIGEFVCDMIIDIMISCSDQNMRGIPFPGTGLTDREIMDYIGNGKYGFGWHISDLVIYDKPKELSEFVRRCKAYGKDTGRCWDCSKSVGDEHDCGANGMLEMKWPHQSWCYVEELEGE